MPARQVYLSDADCGELARVVARDPRPYMRERAAAVLKVAAGASISAVAASGLPRARTRETVGDWISRYEADGVAGLVQLPRGHRGFSPSAGFPRGGADASGPGGLRP